MIKGLSYSQGLQTIGFFGYAMLFICAIITALGLIGAFSNSREYPTVCKVAITVNFITILLIALFSQFYTMAQYTNLDNILSILKVYGFEKSLSYNDFNIYSETLPMAYIAAGLAATLLVVKPFTHVETPMCNTVPSGNYSTYSKIQPASTPSNPALEIMDSCPAFSEIDRKIPEFQAIEQVRKKNTYENISLPKLVNFVVEYARESRLHLSYSAEDIATFVAGLGASKLSILQGMSGTGKTSLPKIFAEAIMGNVDIIEIESSWKDKNELLGYYNEFSKIYTPRKFTQSLYRATLNPDVITFIVLDEMNLSRIEYYFSDFLSLMENEPDKREVRLLNQAIFNNSEGMSVPYAGLTDGHTIKISPNIWFIGTANRDESTFEISDKVYDRACTMNFDKRAPKARSFMEPKQPKYISYDMFDQLIRNAVDSFDFDVERCEIIAKTEDLLQPYNISFGNRIAGQIERFVKIYCSCFSNRNEVINEAIEKILLSKVVAKLEFKTIADKEKLAKQFDKLGLFMCSSFVRKLSEDTMYE